MAKRIKNVSGGQLVVNGQTIADGAYYTLEQHEELAWRDDDAIEALVDAGDIIFNDGTTDYTDKPTIKNFINNTEALQITFRPDSIESNGFNSTEVQSAIEESRDSAIGTLLQYTFISSGNTSDKWLSYSAGGSAPSNDVPLIFPQDSKIKGATFSNKDNDVDIDVEIYINGTLAHTWSIRNKRVAWEVGSLDISVMQTDRVSLFLKKYTGGTGDSTAQDPIITILGKFINEAPASGGIQTGL